jgi:hypothetical protein
MAGVKFRYAPVVHIKPRHPVAVGKNKSQGQSHIAKADDGY